MATCPACRYRFQTLEDEDGLHDCPRCGYCSHSDPPLTEDEWMELADAGWNMEQMRRTER